MTVTVVVVGKVRGELAPAVAAFEERAGHYWKLEIVEVDGGAGGDSDPRRIRRTEGQRILGLLPDGHEVVVLTRRGKGMTSRMLAGYLEKLQLRSAPGVTFVVGGAFGLSDEVLGRASLKLTLSPMTFPHEMARLLLAEQLYRAGTILRGEPYHKERQE